MHSRSFAAPPTLTKAVIDHLRTGILNGQYPPGSSLPEIPLASAVCTSRTTVREALRALCDMGLVVIHPRRGATVASISPKEVREIFSLRAVLETFAVRLAFIEGRIQSQEIAKIESAFEELRSTAERGDSFLTIEADMAFHWTFCSPCDHSILLEHISALQTRTRLFIFYTKLLDSEVESDVCSHLPILNAIRALDADRAEAAVRAHIVSVGERLLVRMSEPACEAQHGS